MLDQLTKMVYYKPVLATLDIEQLAKLLIKGVIKYHGLPNSIITNQRSLFISKFWSSLCYNFNVKRWLSSAFHAKTDGQIKWLNITMEAYLWAYYLFEQNNWVQWLPMTPFACNNSWQASTIMSPFEALFGYHPQIFYKDNYELQSKFRTVDKNATTWCNLMKKLKVNLVESQKL